MKTIIILNILFVLFFIAGCTPAFQKPAAVVKSSETTKPDSSGSKKKIEPQEIKGIVSASESIISSDGDGVINKHSRADSILFADINFDYNQFHLTDVQIERIRKISAMLIAKSDIKLIIEGHTDERGSEEYNLGLGEKRAQVVKSELIKAGAKIDLLKIISYGEENPISHENNESAYTLNRRVHFEVRK